MLPLEAVLDTAIPPPGGSQASVQGRKCGEHVKLKESYPQRKNKLTSVL